MSLSKDIKTIINDSGWEIWFVYNDKRVGGRRLKFLRNGCPVPSKTKNLISSRITRFLKNRNELPRVINHGWGRGNTFRGPYDYYFLRTSK